MHRRIENVNTKIYAEGISAIYTKICTNQNFPLYSKYAVHGSRSLPVRRTNNGRCPSQTQRGSAQPHLHHPFDPAVPPGWRAETQTSMAGQSSGHGQRCGSPAWSEGISLESFPGAGRASMGMRLGTTTQVTQYAWE